MAASYRDDVIKSRWTGQSQPQYLLTAFRPQNDRPPARGNDPRNITKRAAELLDQVAQSKHDLPMAWNDVFRGRRIGGSVLAEAFIQLHNRKKYDVAVEGIEAALRNDHGQPWMYDTLALEMSLAKRPQRQIDRVLASRIDFTGGDTAQKMLTAAMMTRFGAFDRAIEICKSAARQNPLQPTVWGMARRIAQRSGNPDHVNWACTGTIRNVWEDEYDLLHKECAEILEELQQQLLSEGKPKAASRVREALDDANSRDLKVRISWAGDADLDLIVFEPNKQRCSYKQRMTTNGGALIRQSDGGPAVRRGLQYEEYVLSNAPNGEYIIRVRYISGRVISGKVRVDVTRYSDTANEDKKTLTLPIGDTDPEVKLQIKRGRGN